MQLSNANKRFEKNIFIKNFFLQKLNFFLLILSVNMNVKTHKKTNKKFNEIEYSLFA
jgi:hypothetical protein